jgi:tRNA1Val (adenine37-N6)-methyltransferase
MRKPFAMKQFSVAQNEVALPVTSDACVFAALAEFQHATQILDVGSGTGILSLMLAQKYPLSHIHGIDIHQPSVIQAQLNSSNSPFAERISFSQNDFLHFESTQSFDGIICNPPFFENHLPSTDETRRLARHTDSLTLATLTARCARLLQPNGELLLLLPASSQNQILAALQQHQFSPQSITTIQATPTKPPHLIAVYAIKNPPNHTDTETPPNPIKYTHYSADGQLTPQATELLKDFYLAL